MTEFNEDAVKKAHDALLAMTKGAFAPPPPPAAPAAPMPPAAPAAPAGAAGGPPPAAQMPMDPAMMGGGMPMDPAMAGGMPMDPAMMGGMPMDPAMMGGAPPGGAPPEGGEGGTPLTVTLEDLMALFEQVAATTGGGEGAPNESSPNVSKALDKISQRLDAIEGQLGGGEGGAPEDAGIEELLNSVGGAGGGMAEMGGGAPPFSPSEPLPPMPEAMIASAGEVLGQVKSAKKIGDILAGLRKK